MKHISHIIALILFTLTLSVLSQPAFAAELEAGSAGDLKTFTKEADDPRVSQLKAFLHSYGSPLESEAETFVKAADEENLNWTFVAAIAGLESTFGKHIPTGSYNAWGWGIPTGAQSGIGFKDWKVGIQTVSTGLRKQYVDRGAVGIYGIGHRYAASATWAVRVEHFMEKIQHFVPTDSTSLDVSL